ncbi:MAG: oleate hydratase [Candidatus Pacebacteria bacterium]|nr:oleate hydratase [Candidatus Paceibacterota bacterium]
MQEAENKKVYLVGAGIASLASAAYFIKEGKILGKNILIFEESNKIGGSLDGERFSGNAHVLRGYRVFENKVYTSTFNLMSFVPSLVNGGKTIMDDFLRFNEENIFFDKCRLVENGIKIPDHFGLDFRDRWDLIKMLNRSEKSLGSSEIKDHFEADFFETNYWCEVCTLFAFQPWHSAAEFRRYCLRGLHEFPNISTMTWVKSTPYNQYDSIVLPLLKWLKERGVRFEEGSRVYDFDFGQDKKVERIYYFKGPAKKEIIVGKNDYVLATVGSIIADSSNGSMDKVPFQKTDDSLPGALELWENISKKQENFGRPSVFRSNIDKSKIESFTITFQDRDIPELIKKFTGREAGRGEIITFKDSNWLISIIVPRQPYFINQPKGLTVSWGYALSPDKEGNYVKKKMSECNGKEILIELFSHFRFYKEIRMEELIRKSICIPSMLPYGTSQFLPRKDGDRPAVIPKGSKNFAFIGQFCEIPEEIAFTVEYSVRSAQIAVFSLLNIKEKMTPMFKSKKRISVLYHALKAIFK